MKTICYAIDLDTDLVISRVWPSGHYLWPVLDYDEFGNDGDFSGEIPIRYEEFRSPMCEVGARLRWTKKIPVAIKNVHRKHWGMKPLKEAA